MSFKSFSTDSDKTAKRRVDPAVKTPATREDSTNAAAASTNKSTQATAPTGKS